NGNGNVYDSESLLKDLMDRDDVDHRNQRGVTPLMVAVQHRQPLRTIRDLASRSAFSTLLARTCFEGMTCLDWALVTPGPDYGKVIDLFRRTVVRIPRLSDVPIPFTVSSVVCAATDTNLSPGHRHALREFVDACCDVRQRRILYDAILDREVG